MKLCKLAGLVLLSAAFSCQAFAQQVVVPAEEEVGKWEFYGAAFSNSFDKDAAYLAGVDDSAFSIGLGGNYIQSGYRTTLFLDIFMYDDKYGFSQWVEGSGWYNNGDVSNESSDATGISAGFLFGPQWLLGTDGNSVAYVQGGFDAMLSSERGISSCSNCRKEDIKIDGGALVQVGYERNVGSFTLGLIARTHISGDLGSAIGISFGTGF